MLVAKMVFSEKVAKFRHKKKKLNSNLKLGEIEAKNSNILCFAICNPQK
jgi:hypothetical protein